MNAPVENVGYDDVDRHLEAAGSIDRAAVPMGLYLAWCANLQLLSESFQSEHETLVLRVRYREIGGSELLIAGCGGSFDRAVLNADGQRFTDGYYAQYMDDYRSVFGDCVYRVKDDWAQYDRIAPLLTKHYMHSGRHGRKMPRSGARDKKWWQRWW